MNKFTLIPVCALVMGLSACSQNQITGSLNAGTNLFEGATLSKEELVKESRLSAKQMDEQATIAPASSKYAKRLEKLTKDLKNYDGLTLNYLESSKFSDLI